MSLDVDALVERLGKEGEAAIRAELKAPLLVRTHEADDEDEPSYATRTVALKAPAAPVPMRPVAYPVQKGESRRNAFALGITIGRVEGNDVVLNDASVSRFHAYVMQGQEGLRLVDAESHNGTWMNGRRLEAGKAAGDPLVDGTRIRVGSVDLRFMSPDAFVAYLQRRRTLKAGR